MELKDHKANKGRKVHKDSKASPGPPARSVPLVRQVLKDHKEAKATQAFKARQGSLVPLVRSAQKGLLETLPGKATRQQLERRLM